jgi:hypothetical protein
MTVGELKRLLAGVDDTLVVVVRAWDDDADYCGTIATVQVQHSHDDGTPFLAIDCPDPQDDPEKQ